MEWGGSQVGTSPPPSRYKPGSDCGWGDSVQVDDKVPLLSRDENQKQLRSPVQVRAGVHAHALGANVPVHPCTQVRMCVSGLWPSEGAWRHGVFPLVVIVFKEFKPGNLCIP